MMTDIQKYQFFGKFARWIGNGHRETWEDCVKQRISWLQHLVHVHKGRIANDRWAWLTKMLQEQKAAPSLRLLQNGRFPECEVGLYNCAYLPVSDIKAFAEILYISLQGTGVGFSVEREYISQLPEVRPSKDYAPETIRVEDSAEGWAKAFERYLELVWAGYRVKVDTSAVRPRGRILQTKGGYAAGPEALMDLLHFSSRVISANRGRKLSDSDVHRIITFIGRTVQIGGSTRRTALLSLSDLESLEMRHLKRGAFWEFGKYWPDGLYLTTSNNSVVVSTDMAEVEFWSEWNALRSSGTGERGLFNRKAAWEYRPERRESDLFGTNPCGEIVLKPYQFCNLSTAIAREDDNEEKLHEKVMAATYFGAIQSLATHFRYLRPEWSKNCEKERLLGVDITGHADCPLLRYGAPGREELLKRLKKTAVETARKLATDLGINMPAAVTTVKPSGDSSVLFGCAPGIHPYYAKYYTRWVRESKDSPIARFMVDSGVPHAEAPEAPDKLLVFGFPMRAPEGAPTRNDMSALDQLRNWLEWRMNYSEHSVSATIYVDESEWKEVGKWVWNHMDCITGLSFLPKDGGVYRYAPYEEMTREQYDQMMMKWPKVDWKCLRAFDKEYYQGSGISACEGAFCYR